LERVAGTLCGADICQGVIEKKQINILDAKRASVTDASLWVIWREEARWKKRAQNKNQYHIVVE
jgi:hypothetical protein